MSIVLPVGWYDDGSGAYVHSITGDVVSAGGGLKVGAASDDKSFQEATELAKQMRVALRGKLDQAPQIPDSLLYALFPDEWVVDMEEREVIWRDPKYGPYCIGVDLDTLKTYTYGNIPSRRFKEAIAIAKALAVRGGARPARAANWRPDEADVQHILDLYNSMPNRLRSSQRSLELVLDCVFP